MAVQFALKNFGEGIVIRLISFSIRKSSSKASLNLFGSRPASLTASPHLAQYFPNQSFVFIPVSVSNLCIPKGTLPFSLAVRIISFKMFFYS